MQQHIVTVVIALGLASAGCIQAPGPECSPDAPCNDQADLAGHASTPGTPDADAGQGPPRPDVDPLPAPELPFFTFEQCRGVGVMTTIPAERARQHLPPAFDPAGVAPYLASLGVLAFTCPRTVYQNQTLTDEVSVLVSYMFAKPDNSSWPTDGQTFYTYDVLVSDAALARALAGVGVPATEADVTWQSLASNAVAGVEDVQFVSDAVTYRLQYKHSMEADGGSGFDRLQNYWFGNDPFRRIEVQQHELAHALFGADASTLSVTGTSAFADAVGLSHAPHVTTALHSIEWVLDAAPQTYSHQEEA